MSLPSHASVIVIGGGIMGCATLYHLAKMGVKDAILIERNKLTSGTTWHSAAQVRALRNSQNLTKMIRYSVDLYAKLEKETGQNVGWIQKGSLSIATNQDRLTHIKRQEQLAKAYGMNAYSISPQEAKTRWPMMNAKDIIGAVWSPDDGRVSPSDVCAALVKGAKNLGAKIFENTPVTAILTKNNRIRAIETDKGIIKCDAIALCAGLWSREIGKMANADIPVLACEHFYMLTKPIEGITGNMPTLSDHDHHLYIRDDSGGLLVGCFEPMGKPIEPHILNEKFEFALLNEDWEHFEPMMIHALHRIPALQSAEIKMLLNGPESFTPDGMFMLGETAETKGLFLGCGMNSVGIASAGGAGMNLAHHIIYGHTAYDLTEADAKRFAPAFNSIKHLMARVPEILGTHYEIAYPGRQLKTARNIKTLPLNRQYQNANAHFGQFFAWERPLYFNKTHEPKMTFEKPDWFEHVKAEVMAAHKQAALFDASSFGKIEVQGKDAEIFMQHICAANMDKIPGSAFYTAILNERGTYESDITAHRIDTDHYRLFVGTNAVKRDFARLKHHTKNFNVTIHDSTEKYAVLALMGPQAKRIIAEIGAPELNNLGYFKVSPAHINGCHVRAVRMSYVGEAGVEITTKTENVEKIYTAIIHAGAKPAGIYAQTSMRIEKGFAAMQHELDSDISPIEAGLDKLVSKKKQFIGSNALAKRRQHASRTLMTVIVDDQSAVPLGHEPIYADNNIIGYTTSAAFGYRIGKPVALAHIHINHADGTHAQLNIAGKNYPARLQYECAFDPQATRMKG